MVESVLNNPCAEYLFFSTNTSVIFVSVGYVMYLYCTVFYALGKTNAAVTEPETLALKTKLNSAALVRTRTIPTERPPPVGEVSANFCG